MNQWNYQIGANLVDRIQREGIEVVESPFERERRPGRLRSLLASWARRLRGWGERPDSTAARAKRAA
jgi:hypothetical protein